MSDQYIQQLSQITGVSGSYLVPISDSPNGSGLLKSISVYNLFEGLSITPTSGTISLSSGKTITLPNSLTLAGTDGSTITFGGGGTVAYTSNNLSIFAATTSAQLSSIMSDETGTGSLVFNTNPVFASLQSISTTEPARFGYDVNNYMKVQVSNAGLVTLTATGASAGFVLSPQPNGMKKIITCVIDGGGQAPAVGTKSFIVMPFAGTITGVRISADVVGSAVVDVWKVAYGNTAPTVANTIAASALPTLSSALTNQDNTLTGWTTAIAANDLIGFNLNSVITCTKITVELIVNVT